MKDYTVLDGQITCLRNKLYDEAYQRGYEDAKKEFIGMSAKQIQIKYHDDFATALEKMYEYEERQTEEIKVGDEVKVYDDCIGIVTRHAPQARTCYVMYRDGSCGEEELTDCKKTGNHSTSLDKWLDQIQKESE